MIRNILHARDLDIRKNRAEARFSLGDNPVELTEELKDVFGVAVSDRQRLNAKLLLGLQRL